MSEPRGNLTRNHNVRIGPEMQKALENIKNITGKGFNKIILEAMVDHVGRYADEETVMEIIHESFNIPRRFLK